MPCAARLTSWPSTKQHNMSRLVELVVVGAVWAVAIVVDVVRWGLNFGVLGLFGGMLIGLGLQLVLHLVGIAPRIDLNSTKPDWYWIVPALLATGAGTTLGVQYGIRQLRRDLGEEDEP